MGAVFLPTGRHDEKFGSNGRITAKRPMPPNVTAAQGFDAVQKANVDNAFVGDFPFNNGIFGRFAGDGRLPSTLQPNAIKLRATTRDCPYGGPHFIILYGCP